MLKDCVIRWVHILNFNFNDVLNLRYRPHYSKYKDLYYTQVNKITEPWHHKILPVSVRWRNVLNFILVQCPKAEIWTLHSLNIKMHTRLQVIKSFNRDNIIIFVYNFNWNKTAKLYLPSTFQTSDIELLSPKIEPQNTHVGTC